MRIRKLIRILGLRLGSVRIVGTFEGRNDSVLRIPLGIEKRRTLFGRGKNHARSIDAGDPALHFLRFLCIPRIPLTACHRAVFSSEGR